MVVAGILNYIDRVKKKLALTQVSCPRCDMYCDKAKAYSRSSPEEERFHCCHCGLHGIRRTYAMGNTKHPGEWLDLYSNQTVKAKD
jgi:hypothetical protein